jgi:hypothetical protein
MLTIYTIACEPERDMHMRESTLTREYTSLNDESKLCEIA